MTTLHRPHTEPGISRSLRHAKAEAERHERDEFLTLGSKEREWRLLQAMKETKR